MQVQFYDFKKRNNSTAVPGGAAAVVLDGSIKSPSDITNPVIQFNLAVQSFLGYAYIPDFSRYYHVDKWRYVSGLWECEMVCDVLASFKNDILNSSAFVLYSSSNYNQQLIDTRLSTESATHISTTTLDLFGSIISATGSYCIAVASTAATQGVGYYYVSSDIIGQIIELLCTESATELFQQLENLFAGANFNSIISCTWLPFNFVASPVTDIYIANYNTGLKGNIVPISENFAGNLSINWPFTDFRRNDNYIKLILKLPFVGVISLPVSDFWQSNNLNVRLQVDGKTGTGAYQIKGDAGGVYYCTCQLGATIPISGMNVNPVGALTTAGSAIGSFASLSIGSGISQTFDAIQQAFAPTTSVTGDINSNAAAMLYIMAQDEVELNVYYNNWSDNPADVANNIGRPLKAVTNLSALYGYCQCANYSANCGLESETNEINRLMNGGVYIE